MTGTDEYDWRTTTRVILYDEFNRVIDTKYYPKGAMPKISALYKMFPAADRMDIR